MKRFAAVILLLWGLFLPVHLEAGITHRHCRGRSYSLQNPCVIVNPYNVNPLVAVIQFVTKKPAQISLEIVGKDGAAPIKTTFDPISKVHKIPVLGLYPNYNNQIVLTAAYKDKTTETANVYIQTEKITSPIKYIVTQKEDAQTNYYWLTNGMVVDEAGEFRFMFDDKSSIRYYFPGQIVTEDRIRGLKTYTLFGKLKKSYSYPKGFVSFTHGLGLTPSGNFLVIGSMGGKKITVNGETLLTQRDFIIEIDKDSGKAIKQVDLGKLLNPNRSTIVTQGADFGLRDWCHINGIDSDASDESWVVSCRNQGIMKITKKGTLDWLITPKKGFEKSGRDGEGPALWDQILTAVDAAGNPYSEKVQKGEAPAENFKWPSSNHSVQTVEPQVYALYDNAGKVNDPNLFTTMHSNAVVFRVDPEKRTVQTVWMEKLPVYSSAGSNVLYEPLQKRVVVYSSFIEDKSDPSVSDGFITRYDLSTHRPLFSAKLKQSNRDWIYQLQPFKFYPENER